MKNFTYLLILTLGFATACGSGDKEQAKVNDVIATNDMAAIKSLKADLSGKHKKLEKEIAQLDSAINAREDNKRYPLISVKKAQQEAYKHYLELQGDVQTKKNVLIYPEVAGTLVEVKVEDGDKVQKGQLLGIIDNGGLNSQLAQLKTQLALAETTYERQKNLWDKEVGTEMQYLQAKTNYEAQKNAVSQLQQTIAKYQIRAPFSGIIDNVIKHEGNVVSPGPGSEIFRLVNLSNMYVEVPVPENYLGDITKGSDVLVYFPVLNDSINTSVKQTGNFIDPANRSFSVEVSVPNKNGKIKPNLTAKVKINDYTNEKAILVPQSIISENAEGEQYAYIATNVNKEGIATAKKRIIKTGKAQGDYIEVLSGIKAGEQIIIEGARNVRDDQQVKIIANKL